MTLTEIYQGSEIKIMFSEITEEEIDDFIRRIQDIKRVVTDFPTSQEIRKEDKPDK